MGICLDEELDLSALNGIMCDEDPDAFTQFNFDEDEGGGPPAPHNAYNGGGIGRPDMNQSGTSADTSGGVSSHTNAAELEVALAPQATELTVTPCLLNSSRGFTLPPITPMLPVSVLGCAKILSAAHAT